MLGALLLLLSLDPPNPPIPSRQLLTKQIERDILPVLAALADMGCSEADVQLLVWEFPRIFVSSNWRRHVRKFQVGVDGCGRGSQQASSLCWPRSVVYMAVELTPLLLCGRLCCST